MKIIDLSVTTEANPPSDPPSMPVEIDYLDHRTGAEHIEVFFPGCTNDDLPQGLGWAIENVKLTTHSGTHLDAPYHYYPTMNRGEPSRTIDQIPLEWCISDGVMLDFSNKPAGYKVTAADVERAFCNLKYQLKPLDVVLVRSGAATVTAKSLVVDLGYGLGCE